MSNIKNSYRNSHLKLTLAFPFRAELLGKYGQSDHFNKLDDELRFSATRRGGGEIQRHEEGEGGGGIVIILITALGSTTQTGGFNHAGR